MTTPELIGTQNRDPLRNAVGSACHRLQANFFADRSSAQHHSARAMLAELRRGASLDIERNPLALEKILIAMYPDLDEKLLGYGDAPSPSERAAFVALSLFAIHMQSAQEPMHQPGVSFARACGKLNAARESESIKPRVDAMLLATNEQSRLIHIRSLVTLLRSEHFGFDYGLLARDLRGLTEPKQRAGIQLRWGRDFAAGYFHTTSNTSDS